MKKLISYFFQSILVYIFFILGKITGLRISRIFFSKLFLFAGKFFKSEKIIKYNINIFNNTLPKENRKKITEEMWKNYGMTFIEYMFLKKFKKNNNHIFVDGDEKLKEIIKNDKGVIFVSGHFANFELMSMEITKRNYKLATIYRPLNNYFLNPLMEHVRRKYVCKNQIKKGLNGVRDSVEYIKKGFSIALMIDQRVSEGEKIDFFKKSALTTTLPAQLAMKYNLSIIPVYIERKKDNNFNLKFLKEIKANKFTNKIELTKKLNFVLEEMIEKNPYQWIWSHNRWKL